MAKSIEVATLETLQRLFLSFMANLLMITQSHQANNLSGVVLSLKKIRYTNSGDL